MIPKKLSAMCKELFGSQNEWAQNRRNILIEQLLAGSAGALVSSNYLTGLLIRLNLSDTAIGNVSILTFLTGTLQAVSFRFLNRYRDKKTVIIWGKAIAYFINVVLIGYIPFAVPGAAAAVCVFLCIFLFTGINAVVNPGMAAWHVRSIPPAVRNAYFSVFTVVSNAVAFIVIYFSGRIADTFKAAGREVAGLSVLRLIAIPCAILDIFWLTKIREYPEKEMPGDLNLRMLREPLCDTAYRATLLVGSLWNFAANITGPYYNIYLLKDMHVSYTMMALVNLGFILSLFLFAPIWSRYIRRTSYFHTLRVLISCFMLHYVVLSLVTRESIALYPLGALYSYIFLAGINVITAGLPYYGIPENRRISYIGCYSTLTSVASLAGLEAGTLFVTFSSGVRLRLGHLRMGNIQLLMVASAAIMCACMVWIERIEKREKMKGANE